MKWLAPILVLSAAAAVFGAALAVVAEFTAPVIESNRAAAKNKETQELLQLVQKRIAESLASDEPIQSCKFGGAVETQAVVGYGGEMELIVAWFDRELIGARVAAHQETPGFADVLDSADWLGRFGEEPLDEIDTVSRATITTRAVLEAIKKSAQLREAAFKACSNSS
ncbi:MAG: FMN-binding protein [Gammaproteobacteria bacterium]|nr:FMN-binding protein [Gammaproteobacteria bacterium]